MNRIMIAGGGSGCGKTTITCGILNCLKRMGKRPAPFKCGPDYIDTMFHSRVLGIPAGNLDSFFTDAQTMRYLLSLHGKEADIAVIEGVMGLYDGIAFTDRASSYQIALQTETPVILILNCRGMGCSIGAVLQGFAAYRTPGVLAGVIFNQMPESLYEAAAKEAARLGIRPLGYVPLNRELFFESRHLGLVTAAELTDFQEKLDRLSVLLEQCIDLGGILELAAEAGVSEEAAEPADMEGFVRAQRGSEKVRLGIARDAAFCFWYRDNLELLERLGCELVSFSPLADSRLPDNLHGLILSGGYPELYAGQLSANEGMRRDIRERIADGIPCIAECGGFMYLHEWLEDENGRLHPMAGVINGKTFRTSGLKRFGYVTMTAEADGLLCKKGSRLTAHEFHYWDSTDAGHGFLVEKAGNKKQWSAIHTSGRLYAGFPHLYLYGNRDAAYRFITEMKAYRG